MQAIMADLKRGRSWDYIARQYGLGNDAHARRVVREWQRDKKGGKQCQTT